jgi:hypothetical protein
VIHIGELPELQVQLVLPEHKVFKVFKVLQVLQVLRA